MTINDSKISDDQVRSMLQAVVDDVEGAAPMPAAGSAVLYAQGLRIHRRRTVGTALGGVAVVTLMLGIVAGASLLRSDPHQMQPAAPDRPPAATRRAPAQPSGGTVTTSPGQQPPVFSVAEASGPYCSVNPVLGQTVRDQLPADDRWGPDLPMFGICDPTTQGLELPVIQGSKVGVVTVVVDLVNPRVAQSSACQGGGSCQQTSAGWLGTGTNSMGTWVKLVTPDGTRFDVSATASFVNSDLFDGGAGKLPGLAQDPYDTDQLSTLAIALAGKIHIG